jgi:hypothetical protein
MVIFLSLYLYLMLNDMILKFLISSSFADQLRQAQPQTRLPGKERLFLTT